MHKKIIQAMSQSEAKRVSVFMSDTVSLHMHLGAALERNCDGERSPHEVASMARQR